MAMTTPWGTAQHEERIAPGITEVGTAGHGGIKVDAALNRKIREVWRRQGGWYEEDCDAAIVMLTFPQHFPEKRVEAAHRSAKRYYPREYAVAMGAATHETKSAGKCPSCGKPFDWYAGWTELTCSGCDVKVPLHDEQRIHLPDGTTSVVTPVRDPSAPLAPEHAMFTLAPNGLPHSPRNPGGWHCRVLGTPSEGTVHVQEMKVDGGRWRPSMQTSVFVHALRPLAVQLDEVSEPPAADEDLGWLDIAAVTQGVEEALAAFA